MNPPVNIERPGTCNEKPPLVGRLLKPQELPRQRPAVPGGLACLRIPRLQEGVGGSKEVGWKILRCEKSEISKIFMFILFLKMILRSLAKRWEED